MATLDPLVPTGRGGWILMSKTSLPKLLAKFDAAYPNFTDGQRQDVIDGWAAGDQAKRELAA